MQASPSSHRKREHDAQLDGATPRPRRRERSRRLRHKVQPLRPADVAQWSRRHATRPCGRSPP